MGCFSFFFFSSRRRHTRCSRDWSSDVCSSDLLYDGALSHDVAFGPLVRDPAAWIERLTARDGPEIVSIATDGETFGHHHREGAVTLARVLDALRQRGDVRVDTFGAFLARHPPQEDVRDRKSTRLNSSHGYISYAVFCLKKKKTQTRSIAPTPVSPHDT